MNKEDVAEVKIACEFSCFVMCLQGRVKYFFLVVRAIAIRVEFEVPTCNSDGRFKRNRSCQSE